MLSFASCSGRHTDGWLKLKHACMHRVAHLEWSQRWDLHSTACADLGLTGVKHIVKATKFLMHREAEQHGIGQRPKPHILILNLNLNLNNI